MFDAGSSDVSKIKLKDVQAVRNYGTINILWAVDVHKELAKMFGVGVGKMSFRATATDKKSEKLRQKIFLNLAMLS